MGSRTDSDKSKWQDLRKHLDEGGALAEMFAPGAWKGHARVAGLRHDAGKYQLAFQRYIEKDVEASNEGVEGQRIQHAIVGAALPCVKRWIYGRLQLQCKRIMEG